MSLIFMDGFDHYSSVLDKWSVASAFGISSGGVDGSNMLYYGGNIATGEYAHINLGDHADAVIGFDFKINAMTTGPMQFLCLMDGGTPQFSLWIDGNTSEIVACRGGNIIFGMPTDLGRGSVVLTQGAWYHLEVKVSISNSGLFEVRLNENSILVGSGDTQDTANSTWNALRIGGGGGGGSGFFKGYGIDNLYVLDTTGSDNNDFLGVCSVDFLSVDGDGSSSDWTPSAGSNYQCVDDVPADGDTSYVSSDQLGDVDLYTFTALGHSRPIKAAQLVSVARKEDSGVAAITNKTKVGGVVRSATTVGDLTTSYGSIRSVMEKNPDTSAAWAAADFSSSEFGFEVV